MEIEHQKNNSRIIIATVLIAIGGLWLLRKIGFYIDFPHFNLENLFYPIRKIVHHIGHIIFSWQMILIIVGVILMAGKRSAGLVLIIIGGIFILPKLFFFPGLTVSLLLPFLLIGLGVAMVARLI